MTAQLVRYIGNMSTQLSFFKRPINWFRVDIWREWGRYLGERGKEHYAIETELNEKQAVIAEKAGWLMWDVGDWLVAAEQGGMKMSQLRREADEIFPHRKWKTLRNWKVTSNAIEPSRRRDGRQGREGLEYKQPVPVLSYSIHQQVEKFSPEKQEELLAYAVKQTRPVDPRGLPPDYVVPYSVGMFRAHIKHFQEVAALRGGIQPELAEPTHEILKFKITIPISYYKYLSKMTNIMPKEVHSVQKLIGHLAGEYIKEHRAELDAALKAWDDAAPDREEKRREEQEFDKEREKEREKQRFMEATDPDELFEMAKSSHQTPAKIETTA
jgi:hypothetical protein